MSRTSTARTAALAAVLATAALTACSGGAEPTAGGTTASRAAAARSASAADPLPPAARFRPGTCRTVADKVLSLTDLVRRMDEARPLGATDRAQLTEWHKPLIRLRAGAEADVRKPLTDFVSAVGVLRLQVDARAYDPRLLEAVHTTSRALREVCVPAG